MADLQPHQQRVIAEKMDLDDKIAKLEQFFRVGIYLNLPREEQLRLRRQVTYMTLYSNVLGERIAAF